jgi:3-phosphoshikimate 1-carboxyvinyltransferase
MKYKITKRDKKLVGTVTLEGSKSITNRVIIIKALCHEFFEINNFSISEDSETLVELLNSTERVLDARDGGTTFRFLTAFLAVHEGDVILTGSERLQKRPVGPLVDALRSLGAEIDYTGEEGYPPLRIRGKKLNGNRIEIDAAVSSQFVSALLLIAPLLKDGLIVRMKGEPVSRPYIQMTLSVMKHFGIHHEWTQSVISIPHQEYVGRKYNVEGDWTAASYYYAMAALADEVDLKVMGLNKFSYQGDFAIAGLMSQFGVTTTHIEGGIHLTKNENHVRSVEVDFRDYPDLAQSLLVCAAAKGITVKARGMETLEIKETNRIEALDKELQKLGLKLIPLGATWNLGARPNTPLAETLEVATYKDHRMAMAFTPLALTFGEVIIDDPAVVTKSYAGFWEDIATLGFEIEIV